MTAKSRDVGLWSEGTRGCQIWTGRRWRNPYHQGVDRMTTCPPENNAESCSSACWKKENTQIKVRPITQVPGTTIPVATQEFNLPEMSEYGSPRLE